MVSAPLEDTNKIPGGRVVSAPFEDSNKIPDAQVVSASDCGS